MFKEVDEQLLEKAKSGSEDMSVKEFRYVFYLYACEEQYCEMLFVHPLMSRKNLISNHKDKQLNDWEKLQALISEISIDVNFLKNILINNSDPFWVIALITRSYEDLTPDVFKFLLALSKEKEFGQLKLSLMSRLSSFRESWELEMCWYSLSNNTYDYRMTMLVENGFKKHEIPLNILIETLLFYQGDERYEDYFKALYANSNESYKEDLVKYIEQFIDEKFLTDVPLEWLVELTIPFAEENIRKAEENLTKYSHSRILD